MQKRTWTSQQKLQIVLEGLSGQIEITKLCAKHQAHTQYYKWRDQLLKQGSQVFELKNVCSNPKLVNLRPSSPNWPLS